MDQQSIHFYSSEILSYAQQLILKSNVVIKDRNSSLGIMHVTLIASTFYNKF